MSTPFQNRLVGTIIVAAAAVIFLPDLLDGKKQTVEQTFAEIPAKPEFIVKSEQQAFPAEKLADFNQQSKLPIQEADDDKLSGLNDGTVNSEINSQPQSEQADSDNPEIKPQTAPLSPPVSQPELDDAVAWVVQLGSFRSTANVTRLVNKLKQQGFVVFTKPLATQAGPLTQVFVGPETNREKLVNSLEALQKLSNIQGKVVQFQVD